MSGHTPSLVRLEQRAAEADQIIDYLKQQVHLLKEKASEWKTHLIDPHTHTHQMAGLKLISMCLCCHDCPFFFFSFHLRFIWMKWCRPP